MAEDRKERTDRELRELIEELRVILPGVQILAAFLATAAFSSRFRELSDLDRHVYFVAFATSLISAVFLIAPTAQHRLRWREPDKDQMVRAGHRLALVGLGFAAIGLIASAYLITDVVYDGVAATIVTVAVGGAVAITWWLAPLVGRTKDEARRAAPREKAA